MKPSAAADTVAVTIDGIGAGGAGVGRLPDGRAIFVQRTTAGDDAEVSVEVEHKRWARGRLVDITHEGPHRRTPPCPLYMRCGGCTLQHLEYGAQLSAKAHIVAETLRRIGGLEIDVPPIERSPHEFHYRNRASFTLLRAGGRVIAGYHVLENPGRILDVDERCLLLEPSLTAAWRALRDSWGPQAALLPAAPRLRLTLRAAAGGCSLLIEGGQGRGQPEALLAAVPALRSIWSRRDSADRSRRIAGDAALEEQWGDESISMRGGVFVQVNRAMAAQLEAHVLERAGAVRGKNVVDAYCGIGAYTSRLMHAGAHVTGIEIDADATAAAAARLPDARFLVGPVEKLLPQVLPADIVIANPPRAGMHHDACNALHARPPKQLLYVSCDPATLARDVARLGPAFSIASIRCFDMFPQTAHVETVLELTCATS